MTDPNASQDISDGTPSPNGISDVHRAISPVDCLARLREILNDAAQLPRHERDAWLERNIEDAEERQTIAALLEACDDEGCFDADAG